MSEKILYCQVDAHLDTNPKIVRAACGYATAVYQFFLRRVKVLGTDGWVPASNADPAYLARQLHFPEEAMSLGLSRLVPVSLIEIGDSGDIVITGWSDEWSGTSRSNKRLLLSEEEKREKAKLKKQKQRKSPKGVVPLSPSVPGTVPVVPSAPLVPTSEERRGEEIRGEDLPERESGARGTSQWHRHAGWWNRMREVYADLRRSGIQPNRADLPSSFAGVHERNLIACERHLAESRVPPDQFTVRIEHVLQVAAAEARRAGHLDWFIPSKLWDPTRFARALDETVEAAGRARGPIRPAAGSALAGVQDAREELRKEKP